MCWALFNTSVWLLVLTETSVIKHETALLTSPPFIEAFQCFTIRLCHPLWHWMSQPVHCAVANKSYTRKYALTFVTHSSFSFWFLSINFLKPVNTALNSLMYFQQKVWELGEWIPGHNCKLKWSLCLSSWSSIPKHLIMECYNKTADSDLQHIFQAHRSHIWQLVCQQLLSAYQLPFSNSKSQGTH